MIQFQEGADGTTLELIGMHMWRSFVTSSVSRGSTECLWKHSTNLFLFYHRHYRGTTCILAHPPPSHLLSLSALASATWQVASCLIFDMFLVYLLRRPTTVLNVSLKVLFIVNP